MLRNDHSAQAVLEAAEKVVRYLRPLIDRIDTLKESTFPDLKERLATIAESTGDEGVDPFGLDPRALGDIAHIAAFFYRLYFRAQTTGLENIPEGPAILVANHAGQIPIDAGMIGAAALMDGNPPRLVRSTVDRWVPTMPFVSTFYARMGVVLGTPENAERLLRDGSLLLTFPEGMKAVTKTIEQAYQLQSFGLGFMRLAMTTGAPIIPVSVVGSEEQYPTLYNFEKTGRLMGLPSLPFWLQMPIPLLGLLPLPVKYHIHFGEPLNFGGDPDDDDDVVGQQVETVRCHLQEMVNRSRTSRGGIFY